MNKLKCLTIIQFFLFLQCISNAQNLLKPENIELKRNLIIASHDFYKVTIFDSLGNKTGELLNESTIKIDSLLGHIIFARFRQFPFGTHHIDTSIAKAIDLTPLQLKSFNKPLHKSLDVAFNKKTVKVHAFINGVQKDTVYNLEEGYFDDNTIEHLLGYFKLKKGETYRLNTFRYESAGNNPYECTYLFDDLLMAPNNTIIKCAVVQFKNKYTNGYLWYEVSTGRLLKEIGVSKNGSFLVVAN